MAAVANNGVVFMSQTPCFEKTKGSSSMLTEKRNREWTLWAWAQYIAIPGDQPTGIARSAAIGSIEHVMDFDAGKEHSEKAMGVVIIERALDVEFDVLGTHGTDTDVVHRAIRVDPGLQRFPSLERGLLVFGALEPAVLDAAGDAHGEDGGTGDFLG